MASVGSIVGGTFALFRQRPVSILIWGVVYIVGAIAIGAILGLAMGTGLMFIPGQTADPGMLRSMGASFIGVLILMYLLYGMLAVVLINAVYRSILRPNDSAFASLRLGGDELRMFGLTVLFVIALIVLYLISALVLFVVMSVFGAIAGRGGAAGALALLIGLAYFCFWIWLSIRLSLIFPMTFHRRRFAIDEGWALGRGRFWTLFGSYLVVWVILIAISLVLFWSVFSAMFSAFSNFGNPAASQAAFENMAAAQAARGVGGIILGLITSMIVGIASFVLYFGVAGTATRELLAERGEVGEDDAYATAEIFE